jgi:hypothetical protein
MTKSTDCNMIRFGNSTKEMDKQLSPRLNVRLATLPFRLGFSRCEFGVNNSLE